jgi:hypothetical protein
MPILVVAIAYALVAAASAQEPAGSSPMPSRTVWDGVSNIAQAERGGVAYADRINVTPPESLGPACAQ